MTVLECDNGQLPSILVGDSVLLPVKIDITISGNFISAIQYFLSIPQSSHFSEKFTTGARYVDTFCWKLYNSMLTPDQFAWRLCTDLNLPLCFQSRISLQISEQVLLHLMSTRYITSTDDASAATFWSLNGSHPKLLSHD